MITNKGNTINTKPYDNHSTVNKNPAQSVCAAWNNSAIGKTVTAIATQINSAAEVIAEKWNESSIGQFCQSAANSISEFYEEHKTVINVIVGVVVIALCVAATIATGGAAAGALSGATAYMEENGTLDGAGGAIAESASAGFMGGTVSGAVTGAITGGVSYLKNPGKYCFIAGTVILTAAGLLTIEAIRPGDYVYSKDMQTQEQCYKPVLRTFEREVLSTYTISLIS